MDATYREIVAWASEMDRVRGLLHLARSAFPAPSTLWRPAERSKAGLGSRAERVSWQSFEQTLMRVWRQLLRRSATRCNPGDHGALDATFFDRQAASNHYISRSDRHIRTLKATAIVDAESCAVLDIQCSAQWPHDTQVGRQVALRNTTKIESLAGDKGYDDQSLRDALRADGVRHLTVHPCKGECRPYQSRAKLVITILDAQLVAR